jgi:hypothetical protein
MALRCDSGLIWQVTPWQKNTSSASLAAGRRLTTLSHTGYGTLIEPGMVPCW